MDTSAEPDASSSAAVLSTEASGRRLTLADVFHKTGEWEQSRYSVAGANDLQGMAVPLSSCGEDYAAELELRLGHRFGQLTMKVGQADTSASSEDTLDAVVLVNGEQRDARKVPFDKVQPMTIDIRSGNAVKLRFWPDMTSCKGNGITAVVTDLMVK